MVCLSPHREDARFVYQVGEQFDSLHERQSPFAVSARQ